MGALDSKERNQYTTSDEKLENHIRQLVLADLSSAYNSKSPCPTTSTPLFLSAFLDNPRSPNNKKERSPIYAIPEPFSPTNKYLVKKSLNECFVLNCKEEISVHPNEEYESNIVKNLNAEYFSSKKALKNTIFRTSCKDNTNKPPIGKNNKLKLKVCFDKNKESKILKHKPMVCYHNASVTENVRKLHKKSRKSLFISPYIVHEKENLL